MVIISGVPIFRIFTVAATYRNGALIAHMQPAKGLKPVFTSVQSDQSLCFFAYIGDVGGGIIGYWLKA